jgi:hypothetical protein
VIRKAVLAVSLLLVGCSGIKIPPGLSKPKAHINAHRMATVGKPWKMSLVLYGYYPQGPLVVEVDVASGLASHVFSADIAVSRVYQTNIVFTRDLYYTLKSQHLAGLMMHDTGMYRPMDASCASVETCEWDETVSVSVKVSGIEWTTESGWKAGTKYSSASYSVKLSCVDCVT